MEEQQEIEILHLEADTSGDDVSYYRLLVNHRDFKYLTIDHGVYSNRDLTWPKMLISQLPPLPAGEWNLGHITKSTNNPAPHFEWWEQKSFSGIENLWHPARIDYLSIDFVEFILSNVYEAKIAGYDEPVIVKFARFPWETGYYNQETEAYSWIAGHDIGPEFLGHVTEGGRAIGFVLRKLEGRHAGHADLQCCRIALDSLHSLGILHGDTNKHNFLVQSTRAYLIDFESAEKVDDPQLFLAEMEVLEAELLSDSKAGWKHDVEDYVEDFVET